MVIRPLQEPDLPAVRALLGSLIRQHAEREPGIICPLEELDPFANGADPELSLRLVAECEGQICGFAQGEIESAPDHPALCPRRYFSLHDLVVDPYFRRRGIATRLLDACIDWVRERGVPQVELNVFISNEEATAFYERYGFRPQKVRMTKDIR